MRVHSAMFALLLPHPAFGQEHPADIYRVRPLGSAQVIDLSNRGQGQGASEALLGGLAPRDSVGSFDGEDCEVFGQVGDAAVSSSGEIFVLDTQASDVRVFDESLRCLQVVGGPGDGPGEFRFPTAVSAVGAETFVVVQSSGQVARFEKRDGAYQLESQVRIGLRIHDVCVLGDRLFVHGMPLDGNLAIHELSPELEIIRSFGAVYASPSSHMNYVMSMGKIECDAAGSRVIHATGSGLAEVRSYDPNGRLQWVADLVGYRAPAVREQGSSGHSITLDGGEVDQLVSLVALTSGGLLLQVGTSTRESNALGEPYTSLKTVWLDLGSGSGALIGSEVPEVLVWGNEAAVVVSQDPYPVVSVLPHS